MKLTQPFSSSLLKTCSYYLSYQLILWLIHLIFISFISFFHFLLDHRLSVIEEWAFENSWQLAIISKIISATIILRFILVKSDMRIFKQIWESSLRLWRAPYYIYVALIFLFLFMLWSGNPSLIANRDFSLIDSLIAAFGSFVFYGADLLVLFFLRYFYCLRRGELFLSTIFATVVFFWASKIIFIFTRDINSFTVFAFLLLSFVSLLEKNKFTYPPLFLLMVFCPFAGFFGVDLLWGNSRSFLQMTKGIPLSSQIISLIIIVNYISIKRIGRASYLRYLRLVGWVLWHPIKRIKGAK